MMKEKIKIILAFSIAELLVALAIVAVVGVSVVFTVKKQAEKQFAGLEHGTFACYKDSEGKLHQSLTILYPNGKRTVEVKNNVKSCSYSFPKTNATYTVSAIGGGGGGGTGITKYVNNNNFVGSDGTSATDYEASITILKNFEKSIGSGGWSDNYYDSTSTKPDSYSFRHCFDFDGPSLWCRTMDSSNIAQTISNFDIMYNSQKIAETKNFFTDKELEDYLLSDLQVTVSGARGVKINGESITQDNKSREVCRISGLDFKVGDKAYISSSNLVCNDIDCFLPTAGFFYVERNGKHYMLKARGGNSYNYSHNNPAWDNITNEDFRYTASTPSSYSKCKYYDEGVGLGAAYSLDPIYPGGDKELTKTFLFKRLGSIDLHYGTGGKSGEMIVRETNVLSGKTISIEPQHLGDGGKGSSSGSAPSSGKETVFRPTGTNFAISAYGGDAGKNDKMDSYTISFYDFKNSFSKYHSKTVEVDEMFGQVSDYVKNTFNVKDTDLIRGTCTFDSSKDEYKCDKPSGNKPEYFGAGGGGGSVGVYYKSLPIQIKKSSSYITLTGSSVYRSSFGDGGDANGGAIIISW